MGATWSLAENALQAGCRVTKVKGGSIIMIGLWELYEISIWSGSTVATSPVAFVKVYGFWASYIGEKHSTIYLNHYVIVLRKGEVKHHPELCIWYSAFFKLQKWPLASVHSINSYSDGMVV